jgi:hypothetical protein
MAVIGSIDGPNQLITLASGVTEVEVIDIYSEWKNWVQSGTNSKFPPAFRTVGGDPLTSIINAGAYFFLRNDLGWRLKPPEEDITIYLVGNLAVQDTLLPAFVPTDGAFTAAILGLQPVTQGVTPIMRRQLEYNAFSNAVWIDVINGEAGTGYTIEGEPIGTPEHPTNSVQSAVAIQLARGLPRTLMVLGNLTLGAGDDVTGFKIVGESAAVTTLTLGTDATITNVSIDESYVTGTLDGNAIIRNSYVQNLTYFSGYLFQCEIAGTITLGGNAQADILSCYSGVAGQSTPTIDMGGSGNSLGLRDYNGGVKLINKTGTESASIDLAAGQVRIDLTTVTNGKVVVRGDGKVVDDANPDDILLHGMYGNLQLDNETNYGKMVQEIWLRLGLDPDNPVTNKDDGGYVVDGITVVGSQSGTDVIQTRQ